jgi:MoaA/NifB/PqqE/SkfB family radical SAM enzyme
MSNNMFGSRAQMLLRKIPQYTRNQRHLWSVLRHGTPRKWANLARVEIERKIRKVELAGYPYLLIIDPCNYCNLRCPLCPTGLNDLGRPQAMLSFEHFKEYFEPFAPYIFEAYLHNWGESLLNKQVYRMIEYAQGKNVGTNLSSNFLEIDSTDIDNILDCGLEYLVISLDGVSQEVYSQYRVRGDCDRVLENMNELIRRRNSRRKNTPVIEWQFVVMRQNEHQIAEAEALSKKIGVDLLRFIPVGMPFEFKERKSVADRWYPTRFDGRVASDHQEQQFGQAKKPGPCFYLYRSMVVNPDGGISPCCVVYRKNRDFAALNGQGTDIRSIWNNDKYRSARSLFSDSSPSSEGSTPIVCHECDIFEGSHNARDENS